jgi:hypothetical protein
MSNMANGKNLIHGKHFWESAKTKKGHLSTMMRCCEVELEKMQRTGQVAAPFFFERAAVLLRKEKRYAEEIAICEKYITSVATKYRPPAGRQRPQFSALRKRITKAKELLAKHKPI